MLNPLRAWNELAGFERIRRDDIDRSRRQIDSAEDRIKGARAELGNIDASLRRPGPERPQAPGEAKNKNTSATPKKPATTSNAEPETAKPRNSTTKLTSETCAPPETPWAARTTT
jgi:hypothetical protein